MLRFDFLFFPCSHVISILDVHNVCIKAYNYVQCSLRPGGFTGSDSLKALPSSIYYLEPKITQGLSWYNFKAIGNDVRINKREDYGNWVPSL